MEIVCSHDAIFLLILIIIVFIDLMALIFNRAAVLSAFPLDSFAPHPVLRMEIDEKPDEINEANQDF